MGYTGKSIGNKNEGDKGRSDSSRAKNGQLTALIEQAKDYIPIRRKERPDMYTPGFENEVRRRLGAVAERYRAGEWVGPYREPLDKRNASQLILTAEELTLLHGEAL